MNPSFILGRTTMKTKNLDHARKIQSDWRWTSVLARDPSADGKFCYSVTTTGVYCRPSCAARRAHPGNVQFHATGADAEKAGFRPCKRCQPNHLSVAELHAAKIAKVCRLIEQAEEILPLSQLAREAAMSVFHFHRTFKAVTGITPRAYAAAARARRVRTNLEKSPTVTDAIYDAGFNSNSRFYESSNEVLGMTPTRFRAGGAGTDIHFALGECSLGAILVATSERGICAILLGEDPDLLLRDLQNRFSSAHLMGNESGYETLIAKVVGFVEDPKIGLDLPLDIRGTVFQQRVWQMLRQIPVGSTASYTEIARKIGMPKAVRAVARACGANPLAVAIPCHRVIKIGGDLSGYRWGVERKRTLLHREKSR